MSEITSLEPRLVWEQFDAITRVPRPSKKEGKIIDFLVDFAKKHHIEYKKDAIGNVVMRKPATPGMEERAAVILQSHMDMVCEKNSDVEFDFDNDPIRTRIDGEWVRAEGTTLGADCGIGMAAALAVMLDETVEHGPARGVVHRRRGDGPHGCVRAGRGDAHGQIPRQPRFGGRGRNLHRLCGRHRHHRHVPLHDGSRRRRTTRSSASTCRTFRADTRATTSIRAASTRIRPWRACCGTACSRSNSNCAISTAATSAMPFPARLTPSSAFRPASRWSGSGVFTRRFADGPRSANSAADRTRNFGIWRSTEMPAPDTAMDARQQERSRRWSARWCGVPNGVRGDVVR